MELLDAIRYIEPFVITVIGVSAVYFNLKAQVDANSNELIRLEKRVETLQEDHKSLNYKINDIDKKLTRVITLLEERKG